MAQARLRVRRSEESLPACSPAAEDLRLGPLANMIGFHLRLAQSASFHAFSRRLDGVDVSPGWFAVLALIGENPGITQTALSRADTRDKSTLTPILDDLDRRGLITRERLPSNRRSYSLSLTKAGVKLRDELMKHARAHEHELDQIVGPGGMADLIGNLRRITTAFV
jgi:DNA-binding MarR family transcriptional regulator